MHDYSSILTRNGTTWRYVLIKTNQI